MAGASSCSSALSWMLLGSASRSSFGSGSSRSTQVAFGIRRGYSALRLASLASGAPEALAALDLGGLSGRSQSRVLVPFEGGQEPLGVECRHTARSRCRHRLPVHVVLHVARREDARDVRDRKSTRLNSSHVKISYAVFCLKKKNT